MSEMDGRRALPEGVLSSPPPERLRLLCLFCLFSSSLTAFSAGVIEPSRSNSD